MLTGNDKGQFTLWNGQSFNYESITQVHDDSIRQLAYSHNGQGLVSTDKSGAIKYFTPHLTNVHGFQGHREACHGVAWSPNDEKFVTGGDDGLVKIWNYRAATEERPLSGELCRIAHWVPGVLTDYRSWMGCAMRRLASDQGTSCQWKQRHAGQVLGSQIREGA